MGELSGKRNQLKKEGRAEKKERKEQEKEERKAKRENRNIRREIILLEEIKDILDELNMIRIVLEEQRAVWKKLTDLIAGVGGAGSGGSDGKDATLSGGAKNSRFLTYYNDMTNLDTSTREVAKMIEDAHATQDSVSTKDIVRCESIWAFEILPHSLTQLRSTICSSSDKSMPTSPKRPGHGSRLKTRQNRGGPSLYSRSSPSYL